MAKASANAGNWIRATIKGPGALYTGQKWICSIDYELIVERAADGSYVADGYFEVKSYSPKPELADLTLRLSTGEHVIPKIAEVRSDRRVYFQICDPVSTGICMRAVETTPASFVMSQTSSDTSQKKPRGGGASSAR